MMGLTWKEILLYIDDAVVFSATFEEHLKRLRRVFERLREANLKLKPTKCLQFLGHMISAEGLSPLPEKCEAVKNFPTPTKVKEIRAFLGLSGFYRKYIRNFSKIASPLINLTKKDVKFHWDEDCEHAFQTLKDKLTSSYILIYPDFRKPYRLQTDASAEAVGMVLSQNIDGLDRVICYGGKRLLNHERNYSTTELECLAVVVALKQYESYLRGSKVKIVTGHSAFKWLLTQLEPKGRMARWIAFVQQFDYTIEHRAGTKMGNADGLSRRSYADDDVVELDTIEKEIDDAILPPNMINVNQLAGKQQRSRSPTPQEDFEQDPTAVADTKTAIREGKRTVSKPRPVFKYPDVDWTKERMHESQRKDPDLNNIIEYLES